MLLNHSGWSTERLFRLAVQRANGLRNAVTASGPTPAQAPEFAEFAAFAKDPRALQLEDALLLGRKGTGDAAVLTLAVTADGAALPAFRSLQKLLGLQEGKVAYPLRAGAQAGTGEEIVIQTRSLNGVLYFLANGVAVPEAHRNAGLVVTTRDAAGRPFPGMVFWGGCSRCASRRGLRRAPPWLLPTGIIGFISMTGTLTPRPPSHS